jgi:hypothetical protein
MYVIIPTCLPFFGDFLRFSGPILENIFMVFLGSFCRETAKNTIKKKKLGDLRSSAAGICRWHHPHYLLQAIMHQPASGNNSAAARGLRKEEEKATYLPTFFYLVLF